MKFVGIDWAVASEKRAAATLEYDHFAGRLSIDETGITSPLSDKDVIRLCRDNTISIVAVDIPFGWPVGFREFVQHWKPTEAYESAIPKRDAFRFRETDQFAQRKLEKWPLSVSSDRIALGARAWIEMCADAKHQIHAQVDVLGKIREVVPTVIEVYPAATLAALAEYTDLVINGYKQDEAVRRDLVAKLLKIFELKASTKAESGIVDIGKHSDATDAFVAALTGFIYWINVVAQIDPVTECLKKAYENRDICKPDASQVTSAEHEGWIFFPIKRTAT